MRKSRAKINPSCTRCGGPKTNGNGIKFCGVCRTRACNIEGCNNVVHAQDMCKPCHQRWWREKDRKENKVPAQFWYGIKNKYGLTREEYEAIMMKQKNLCPLCQKTPERWCVDHNHETGEVRGLLCFRCNSCLEFIEDEERLKRALQYLDKVEEQKWAQMSG